MADNANRGTEGSDRQSQMEKSYVGKASNPNTLNPEFEKGDYVKLSVLENGVRKAKKMEVDKATLNSGKWKYQVKPAEGGALYLDENGSSWVPEVDLTFWP